MEWVETAWVRKHKWLLSWIINASESTLLNVTTLDLLLFAQEDKFAVEDKWSKWHFDKVSTLSIWWWNTADRSTYESR